LLLCYGKRSKDFIIKKLENFLNKLEISNFFPTNLLDDFYKKIKELKEEIEEENKEKVINLVKYFNVRKKKIRKKGMNRI
jgi:hypothetical protein